MRKFTDANGRDWSIVVNVGTAKKVRDLTDVDIFNLFTSEVKKVFNDPITLVNVLYVLVSDECKQRGVTEEQFGEGLVGDALENAANAMMEEVANFFPSSRRAIAMKTIEKAKTAAKAMEAKAMEALEQIDLTSLKLSTN